MTKVLIRSYRTEPLKGKAVAIFPELSASRDGSKMVCYDQEGHNSMSLGAMVELTERTDDCDIQAMVLNRLSSIGYQDLELVQDFTVAMYTERKAQAAKDWAACANS